MLRHPRANPLCVPFRRYHPKGISERALPALFLGSALANGVAAICKLPLCIIASPPRLRKTYGRVDTNAIVFCLPWCRYEYRQHFEQFVWISRYRPPSVALTGFETGFAVATLRSVSRFVSMRTPSIAVGTAYSHASGRQRKYQQMPTKCGRCPIRPATSCYNKANIHVALRAIDATWCDSLKQEKGGTECRPEKSDPMLFTAGFR
jgi:hypothetical protein